MHKFTRILTLTAALLALTGCDLFDTQTKRQPAPQAPNVSATRTAQYNVMATVESRPAPKATGCSE